MKKIIITFVIALSLSAVLHAERSQDVFPGVVEVEVDSGNILIYDRSKYSIKAQNEAKIQRNLNRGVCSNKGLRAKIMNGDSLFFIYLYKDGTLSLSVTKCY